MILWIPIICLKDRVLMRVGDSQRSAPQVFCGQQPRGMGVNLLFQLVLCRPCDAWPQRGSENPIEQPRAQAAYEGVHEPW